METCFNYCYFKPENKEVAFFSSDEKRWINKIHKLAKEHPEAVTILREPEVNDGCIYCRLPSSWLKVQAPAKKKPMTEEQKQIARERLNRVRPHK